MSRKNTIPSWRRSGFYGPCDVTYTFWRTRPHEQLNFDYQIEIAERMGFVDQAGKRGVEAFMQVYYRHAKDVGELTRFLCAALEGDQKKSRPGVGAFFRAPQLWRHKGG